MVSGAPQVKRWSSVTSGGILAFFPTGDSHMTLTCFKGLPAGWFCCTRIFYLACVPCFNKPGLLLVPPPLPLAAGSLK